MERSAWDRALAGKSRGGVRRGAGGGESGAGGEGGFVSPGGDCAGSWCDGVKSRARREPRKEINNGGGRWWRRGELDLRVGGEDLGDEAVGYNHSDARA